MLLCLFHHGFAQSQGSVLLSQFSISGAQTFPDGTPLVSENIQYRLIIKGYQLFTSELSDCPASDPHMPGLLQLNSNSDASGKYSILGAFSSGTSITDSQCKLPSPKTNQIDTFNLNASILADSISCPIYCRKNPNSTKCIQACTQGQRVISATKTLTQLETQKLIQSSQNGKIQWNQDLVFTTLGPPLSDGWGPDLRVNSEVVPKSIQITEQSFKPDACEVQEKCVFASGNRKLLKFDGSFMNLGQADLVLGDPTQNPNFKFDSCHQHYHFEKTLLYELLDSQTRQAVIIHGQGVIGRKNSFCIEDMYPSNAGGVSNPQYDCLNQGLSVGWEDSYDASLSCQWLDITNAPSGKYILRITINPDGVLPTGDSTQNSAEIPVTIP